MAKNCSVMLIILCGCQAAGDLDTAAFLADIDRLNAPIVSKLDMTQKAIEVNTESVRNVEKSVERIEKSVESLQASILETRQAVGTTQLQLESSLVSSQSDPGKEVIKSEDTSPDKNANDSQLAKRSVAESGDVPLFVSVTSFCRPCNQIKRDWKAGKLKGFKITWCVTADTHKDGLIADGIPVESIVVDTWQPADGFPAIRYPSTDSPTGWAVFNPHGYGALVLHDLRRDLLGVEAEGVEQVFPQAAQTEPAIDLVSLHNSLHGGGSWTWPGDLKTHLESFHGVDLNGMEYGQERNQVVRSRSVIRFVPYRPNVNWRSRIVSRASCPTCPR